MTLELIAADIRRYASDEIKAKGLEVIVNPTDSPDVEDDEIILKLAGRELVTHLQVSSLSGGSWRDASISSYVYKETPLGSTGFVCFEIVGVRHLPLLGPAEKCVAKLMQDIRRTDYATVPVDDIEKKIATDMRLPGIVQSLETVQDALPGNGDIRLFSESGVVDQVALFCDDVEFMRVKLIEHHVIVTNVLRNEEQNVSSVVALQKAIEDLAYASYSAAP